MLRELFSYLTASCPQYVRHMSYLSEAIAMRERHRRNAAAWQPHLDRTRRFLLSSAGHCANRNRIVVLGAGLLLDVPLDDLAAMFREVVLIDIVFLPDAHKRAQRHPNVKLVQADVTNVAEHLYRNTRQGSSDLPASVPNVRETDGTVDLVVSLNILSQLWVMPRAYALNKLRGLDPEQVDDWCRSIVKSHYTWLRGFSCTVCMVGDYEAIKRDKQSEIVRTESTVFSLDLPRPEETWTWNIVPLGEDSRFLSKELVVGAWYFPAIVSASEGKTGTLSPF